MCMCLRDFAVNVRCLPDEGLDSMDYKVPDSCSRLAAKAQISASASRVSFLIAGPCDCSGPNRSTRDCAGPSISCGTARASPRSLPAYILRFPALSSSLPLAAAAAVAAASPGLPQLRRDLLPAPHPKLEDVGHRS